MSDQTDQERRRLEQLLGPTEPDEISCETCFDVLDEYVDLELERGVEAADARVPGLRAHLEGCPACREDHESLRALVSADQRQG